MKITFPILALVVLSACASPQVTVTSEVTVTSTPTPTEILPTFTPTPVAVEGIAEDAEGNKLAYLNGEWMVLPAFDDAQSDEIDRVVVLNQGKENQRIVALGADDAELYELSAKGDEWIKLEKVYESCVDPELIEKVVYPQFTDATGYTPEEALRYYLENNVFEPGIGFHKESGLFKDDMLFLGTEVVSLNHLPGAQPDDRLLCGYGLFEDPTGQVVAGPDKATPIPLAIVYKGKYMPMTLIANGDNLSYSQTNLKDLEIWLEGTMPKGSRVHVEIQTLSGVSDMSQLDSTTQLIFRDNWITLLNALDSDFLKRMSRINGLSRAEMMKMLDVSARDPGLPARLLSVKATEVLSKSD